ncbi:MAG: glycosyltransferase family 4 protein [Saprospiraceae bacterium]|nr:glycosyltransferase family 4 protein [Saprospiraceae bacterium]
MKIVFISDKLPPAVDGVGDYTYFLGEEFAITEHEVHVVCATLDTLDAEVTQSMQVHPVVSKWNQAGIRQAIQCIQAIQPDWVLLQYVPYSFSNTGTPWEMRYLATELKKLGIPMCTTFHEVCIRLKFNNLKTLIRGLSQRLIARSIAKQSVKNITSIDFYVNYLRQWTSQVQQIQIGSNIPPVLCTDKELTQLRQSITPNGEFLIATFGKRDHVALLRLFKKLITTHPNCKLLICGKNA